MTARLCSPAITRAITASCTPRKAENPNVSRRIDSGSATDSHLILCSTFVQGCFGGSVRPDVHPLLGRQIKLVAGLDVEGGVPGVDVPHDAVHPIFLRAVRVGEQLRPHRP